jgi:hypothetical protein
MAFTELTRNALANQNKKVVFRLRLRTEFPESNTFQEFVPAENGFRLTRELELPAMLEFTLAPLENGVGVESDPSNRIQLFARCELWCDVYYGANAFESERLFDGIVTELTPDDGCVSGVALDRLHILSRTVACVEMDADTIEIDDGTPIVRSAEFDELTYGLDIGTTPDGFSLTGVRRAWQAGDIRVINQNSEEVPYSSYTVYPDSGVVRFNKAPFGSFMINGVRCYVEGTNDVADIVRAALTYGKENGGAGIPVGELELNPLGIDINRVNWCDSDGSVVNFWTSLKKLIPSSVILHYDSTSGKFKLGKVVQKPEADLELMNPIRVNARRNGHEIYTRVVVKGKVVNPKSLTDEAAINDLLAGQGEIYRWDGSNKIFGEGTVALIADGNANSGFGHHNLSGEPYDWKDFVLIDLGIPESGSPHRISRIDIVAGNSHNPNSQSGANAIFLYGYDILGSTDGVDFVRVSPDARMYLKPLEIRTIENPTFDRLRYLKVRVKPAKDGLSNQNDPGCALNEIRVYASTEFEAVAAIQGDEPQAEFYYPSLVEKTASVGYLTYIENAEGVLDYFKAINYSKVLLNEFIRSYQRVEFVCVVDPMIAPMMTAGVRDPLTGLDMTILVERVTLERGKTIVTGVNYLAQVE